MRGTWSRRRARSKKVGQLPAKPEADWAKGLTDHVLDSKRKYDVLRNLPGGESTTWSDRTACW